MTAQKKPKPERPTTVRLPDAWYEELRTRAFHERTTISDLIRDALRKQYPNLPKEAVALG